MRSLIAALSLIVVPYMLMAKSPQESAARNAMPHIEGIAPVQFHQR